MIENNILLKISTKSKTPSYVFDLVELENRLRSIKQILGQNINLCYAIKANPLLVSYMQSFIDRYEVCSFGELDICKKENLDMAKIVLSGVNKNGISTVIQENSTVGIYTIESLVQLNDLNILANHTGYKIEVLLRLSSGNQFGMDMNTIENIIANRNNYKNLDFIGIQYYSATQKKNFDIIKEELIKIYSFCDSIAFNYDFTISEIEYGPGLPINYFEPNVENNCEMLQELADFINSSKKHYKMTLELGRYIVATCGIYLTKVVDLKTNNGQNYCIVDGGINHINYYGQALAMRTPKFNVLQHKSLDSDNSLNWFICGSLCTTQDIIIKNAKVDNLQIEDLFVFYNAGAYSITEAMYLFLSRDLPTVITVDKNCEINIIRKSIPTSLLNSRKN